MMVLFLNIKSGKLADKKMCSDKLLAAGHVLSSVKFVHFSIFQFPIMHSVCPPNFA